MSIKKEALLQECFQCGALFRKNSVSQISENDHTSYTSALINSRMPQLYRIVRHALSAGGWQYFDGTILTLDEAQFINDYMLGICHDAWLSCERYYSSKKQKRTHAETRLDYMFISRQVYGGQLYFCTFTFSDDYMEKTTADTRRQKIQRTLRASGALDYYGNIDFGKKNGREHYHALVYGSPFVLGEVPSIDEKGKEHVELMAFEEYTKKVGFVGVERVADGSDGTASSSLGKYIQKFANHASKESVGCDRAMSKCGVDYKWIKELLKDPTIVQKVGNKRKTVSYLEIARNAASGEVTGTYDYFKHEFKTVKDDALDTSKCLTSDVTPW